MGTVIVTDPDAADVGQLSFKIEDNSGSSNGIVMFAIDQGKGGRYGEARISTAPTAVLNYERKSSYALRISASDTANHTATATVAVNLIDVNEAPVTKVRKRGREEERKRGRGKPTLCAVCAVCAVLLKEGGRRRDS